MLGRIPIFWKLSAAFLFIVFLVFAADFLLERVDDLAFKGNQRIVFIIVLAVALSSGSAWFFVIRFIKRPINRLAEGMNKLAEKEFDYRLEEDDKDEFGSLASSFNDMASMLSAFLVELKKTRDYLQSVLESSADIIITVNPSGHIQTINAGAEKALGYQRLEVIGQHIEKFFADPKDRDLAIAQLEYSDDVVNYETQFLTKEGKAKDVLLTISRLRNPTGEIIGTIGISKDITEEKRLQNQLIQSQRLAAIGEVFTGIQHSLKNMLNACKGGSYMVRTGLAKDDRKMLEEGWEIVQQGIERMTDMSTDMLKYVKEWKPRFDKVDLAQVLSEIYRVIKQTAKDKGVKIRLNISRELPSLICDARMIYSAVMDIVSNALDACLWKDYGEGEVPEVSIGAYKIPDRRELVIEVKDNGCGMTEEVKANIFTPFFSTKSKAGTGLGLSITSRMINIHNGRIDVESEPDRGTVFRIALPLDTISGNQERIDGKKSPDS
ncbi:MAG: PAS domain S-box protein [Candidatus Zixiibacteriota bacterium]|nr:MAG: PAS domain S-box protein [candidate division Zixibacteria bacterium]